MQKGEQTQGGSQWCKQFKLAGTTCSDVAVFGAQCVQMLWKNQDLASGAYKWGFFLWLFSVWFLFHFEVLSQLWWKSRSSLIDYNVCVHVCPPWHKFAQELLEHTIFEICIPSSILQNWRGKSKLIWGQWVKRNMYVTKPLSKTLLPWESRIKLGPASSFFFFQVASLWFWFQAARKCCGFVKPNLNLEIIFTPFCIKLTNLVVCQYPESA